MMPYTNTHQKNFAEAKAAANTFLEYRKAVNAYAFANPSFVGAIPDASLDLPTTLNLPATWSNRVAGSGRVYVYGNCRPKVYSEVFQATNHSEAIGRKVAGNFHSPVVGDTGEALPAYISNGAIVSMIER